MPNTPDAENVCNVADIARSDADRQFIWVKPPLRAAEEVDMADVA